MSASYTDLIPPDTPVTMALNIRYLLSMTPTKEPVWRTALSGAKILFVAFGVTVLVPLFTGSNPGLALLGNGIRTRREVFVYLCSSFAIILLVIYSVQIWRMQLS